MAEGGVNGAGTGDMVGPASAVAHNLVSFSNTGGKTGEDSGVSRDQVNFANLVESTSAIDSDADYLKIWKASDTTYHKILARLLGRKLENIILPAQGLWPKKTLGCLPATNLETPTYKRYIAALPFATGAKSYGEIDFFLPWYYSGTPITVCFHWMTTTANAGSVCWGIQGAVFGDGDIIDVADGTAQEISDSSHVTAYAELITEPTGVLTLAGVPAGRKKCILSIYRDPAKDTLVDTAYLTGVYIDYGCLE
jgi:hypothetical protein